MPGQAAETQPSQQSLNGTMKLKPKAKFELLPSNAPKRSQVEDFIFDKYHQVHGASLNQFLPLLLQLTHSDTIVAAVGIKPGQFRPLFLEQYLDSPIEQQVSALTRKPFDRGVLAEVGNLAITTPGAAPSIFVVLASSLFKAGYQWSAFTVTHHLDKILRRLGFKPNYVQQADPGRLESDRTSWGNYYTHAPKVMLGNLAEAINIINQNPRFSAIQSEYAEDIDNIATYLKDYRRLVSD